MHNVNLKKTVEQTRNAILEKRYEIANKIFEEFDFEKEVETSNGWEYNGLNTFEKQVFLKIQNGADTEMAYLTVRFENNMDFATEAFALLKGDEIGKTGSTIGSYR